MMKPGLFIFGLFMILLLGWTSLAVHVEYHENVHKQIYVYHGCNNVTIEFNHLWLGGSTQCNVLGYHESDQVRMLHSMNEITGYHQYSRLITLWLIVYFMYLMYSTRD